MKRSCRRISSPFPKQIVCFFYDCFRSSGVPRKAYSVLFTTVFQVILSDTAASGSIGKINTSMHLRSARHGKFNFVSESRQHLSGVNSGRVLLDSSFA